MDLLKLINDYGRACRRDGSPAWESDEGQALKAALESRASNAGGAVAYIPDDALARLTPPLLVLDGVRLYRYNGVGTTALYLRPVAESDKREIDAMVKRLRNHQEDKRNTAFARSTMMEVADWLAAMSREQSGGQ